MPEPRPCVACGAYHLYGGCPADYEPGPEPAPICPACLAYDEEPHAATCPLATPDREEDHDPAAD